jgi:hypothetical protein
MCQRRGRGFRRERVILASGDIGVPQAKLCIFQYRARETASGAAEILRVDSPKCIAITCKVLCRAEGALRACATVQRARVVYCLRECCAAAGQRLFTVIGALEAALRALHMVPFSRQTQMVGLASKSDKRVHKTLAGLIQARKIQRDSPRFRAPSIQSRRGRRAHSRHSSPQPATHPRRDSLSPAPVRVPRTSSASPLLAALGCAEAAAPASCARARAREAARNGRPAAPPWHWQGPQRACALAHEQHASSCDTR